MTLAEFIILGVLFFLTSVIGVVTGSNSLITVPVMFQFGIDPKVAIATNMFGLTFMNIGATIPFLRHGSIDRRRVTPLVLLTLAASGLGAVLVLFITPANLKLIVSVAMIFVGTFILLRRNAGVGESRDPSRAAIAATYGLTFALGIYGGLYSGGYVTMLTAVLVSIFGMTFGEAVASTKLINIFSSGIAAVVFMWQGLVDYKLGLIIAVIMFAGAYAGARTVTKMSDVWLRRIFLGAVFFLAVKTVWDLF